MAAIWGVTQTKRFSVLDKVSVSFPPCRAGDVCVALDDSYASELIQQCFFPSLSIHSHNPLPPVGPERSHASLPSHKHASAETREVQWREYDLIDWDRVLKGAVIASSFCVRKGMSRKAQLANTCKRFMAKRPHLSTHLKKAMPESHVVQTWEAFDEDVQINLGGDVAAFGNGTLSVLQKLELCLDDVRDVFNTPGAWIVKPSYANKGAEIGIVNSMEELQAHLLECSDLREWVLQRYVEPPLLFRKRKFHLRAYILAVGAIKVYFWDSVLLLSAQKRYDQDDYLNTHSHLTNTAVQATRRDFDESECVHLLHDLASEKSAQRRAKQLGITPTQLVGTVLREMQTITSELFQAYKGEFSAYQPLPNAFEHYGLDFMLDEDWNVTFLEVNPQPDFKQTGHRLGSVVEGLFRDTLSVALTRDLLLERGKAPSAQDAATGTGFTAIYEDDWIGSSQQQLKLI